MGNLVINNPLVRWNSPQSCLEDVWVDVFFSTTYGAGGDPFVAADIDKIVPGLNQDMSRIIGFDAETVQAQATGTITLAANVANNDTVTIGAGTWDSPAVTYTFKTVIAAQNDILIGGSANATLNNLRDAINGAAGFGTTFHTLTQKRPDVLASVAASVLTLQARLLGNRGNAIALAKVGANITVSGATLTGGAMLGWSVQLDRHNKKLSMWNGSAENATADVHLRGVRCHFVFFRDPSAAMYYN